MIMKSLKNNKGSALLLVLVVALCLGILAAVYSLNVRFKIRLASRMVDSVKAQYLASAGLVYQLYSSGNMYYYDQIDTKVKDFYLGDEREYKITTDSLEKDDVLIVFSEAKVNGVLWEVEAQRDTTDSLYKIKNWYGSYGDDREMPIIKWN